MTSMDARMLDRELKKGSAEPISKTCATSRSCRRIWRASCGEVSADLPLAEVRTLDEVYDQSMARASFTLVMLAIAGAMALRSITEN